MLKVGLFETKTSKKLSAGNAAEKKNSVSFDAELADAVQSSYERDLDTMMGDLKDQERRFLDRRDLAELNNYKKQIQKILSLISSDAFEHHTLKRRSRNRADFLIVKKVNEKLLELTKKISSGNRAFDLFRELDEIRGLVLDLVK